MMTFEEISSAYPVNLRGFRRNILREYLQYKILQIIFNSPQAKKLSFIGGTALRIVYGNTRFSEDLDFDNFDLTQDEFDNLSVYVKQSLEREGYEVEIKNVYKKAFRCYVRFPRLLFESGLTPIEEEKILVQLDTMAHGFKYRPQSVILNKFDVFTEIAVTPADILLSQKIFAAMTRKRTKGRDFFDIVFLLGKTKPNYQYLSAKLDIDDSALLRKKLLSFCRRLDFAQLAKEVEPLIFSPSENQRVLTFPKFIKSMQ